MAIPVHASSFNDWILCGVQLLWLSGTTSLLAETHSVASVVRMYSLCVVSEHRVKLVYGLQDCPMVLLTRQ